MRRRLRGRSTEGTQRDPTTGAHGMQSHTSSGQPGDSRHGAPPHLDRDGRGSRKGTVQPAASPAGPRVTAQHEGPESTACCHTGGQCSGGRPRRTSPCPAGRPGATPSQGGDHHVSGYRRRGHAGRECHTYPCRWPLTWWSLMQTCRSPRERASRRSSRRRPGRSGSRAPGLPMPCSL